jgi:hypothetical protein
MSKWSAFVPAFSSLSISLSRFPKSHNNKEGKTTGASSNNVFKRDPTDIQLANQQLLESKRTQEM